MNILITGAKGFMGRNLVASLNNIKLGKDLSYKLSDDICIWEYDVESDPSVLSDYCKNADFIFHLAGVNRPQESSEYMSGNFGFTSTLLGMLKDYRNNCPIVMSSSIQASLNNPYGESKKAGEDLLLTYGKETMQR